MFERLQKPFLTVETGEAYQPLRLTYDIISTDALVQQLGQLKCLEKKSAHTWDWKWSHEANELRFDSISSFQKDEHNHLRLGTLTLKDKKLYINLPSFKRACLAVSFFFKHLSVSMVNINRADFINNVFGLNEQLPHGFSELFHEDELENIVIARAREYEKIKNLCEDAESAEEAFNILSQYTHSEAQKPLPFAERYVFETNEQINDPDVAFLGFYIFLRGRELVAIRRWFGETGYSLADAVEETVEKVFGGMDIDIIE